METSIANGAVEFVGNGLTATKGSNGASVLETYLGDGSEGHLPCC